MMKIKLQALQISFFTRSLDLSDKLSLAQKLSKSLILNLDGESTILPIPNDAPREIPRIILKSKDNTREVNISPIRLDLFIRSTKPSKNGIPNLEFSSVKTSTLKQASELIKITSNEFNSKISRLAVISNFIIKLDSGSKKYLFSKYLQNKSFKQPEEIKLHVLTKTTLDDYKVNEWLRFETLRNQKNPKDDTALRMLLDINSFAEVEYDFSSTKNAKNFLSKAFELIDTRASTL